MFSLGLFCSNCLRVPQRITRYPNNFAKLRYTSAAQSSNDSDKSSKKIVVPLKIKRSRTAVLDALAETVQKGQGPSYGLIDDPALLPYFKHATAQYGLSKISGQKAARYVIENYPHLFEVNPMEPMAEYPPGFKLQKQTEADTLDALLQKMEMQNSREAFSSYQKLKQKGEEIPDDVLHQLLALLCIHNSEDCTELTDYERYFRKGQVKTRRTWQTMGLADQVFSDMKEPSIEACNTMVRGRAMYNAIREATDLLTEMKEKRIPVHLETYNAMIPLACSRTSVNWPQLKELLVAINTDGLTPNHRTFDNILHLMATKTLNRKCPIAIMVLNEMKALGIECTLSTWFYVLQIFYPPKVSVLDSGILRQILAEIDGKDLVLGSSSGYEFFARAMTVCFFMQDIELAYKVDQILNHGNNYKFLGTSEQESIYLGNFLRLLCMFEQIDDVIAYFEKTLHCYSRPHTNVFAAIVEAVNLNNAPHYLPQLWPVIVHAGLDRQDTVMEPLIEGMATKIDDPELQETFLEITEDIVLRVHVDEEGEYKNRLRYSGPMVGYLWQIYLNNDQFDKAWEKLQYYKLNKYEVNGFPTENAIVQLLEACIKENNPSYAMDCLQLMSDCVYTRYVEMREKILREMRLSDEQMKIIEDLE